MLSLLQEYRERRTLISVLTQRSLIARYRGTVLGFLWTFLHPLLLFSVYALVFGVYVRIDVEGYAGFLLAGLLPWTWFASCMAISTTATIGDGPWIRQAAFSPAISPLVACLATGVNFLLELPILLVVLLVLGRGLTVWLLLLPLVIAIQLALTLGLAWAVSALSVRYRDVIQLVQALLPIWFFLTPVVYPASLVPAHLRWLLELNPLAHLVGAYQAVLFEGQAPSARGLTLAAVSAGVICVLGARILNALRDRIPEEL